MPHTSTPATPYPAQRFTGKCAIVTGASRGIGLAIAQRLIHEGARVLITARRQEPLDAALEVLGGSALAVAGHADDPDHRAEVLDAAEQHFGRLDILVNNAGINPVYGPLETAELDAARKIFEVNVFGTLAWTQAVLDWEMATLGDPLADLGYLSATYAQAGTPSTLLELTPVTAQPGYLDRGELAQRYNAHFGLNLSALPWYQALALWKAAVFSEAIYTRWKNGERSDGGDFGAALETGVPRLLETAAAHAARLP